MDPFPLQLTLSVVVGGVWITLATVAAERFGSRLGGFLAGLPSTLVVAMFFIAWTQGPQRAYQVTAVLPPAFAVNAVFLVAYSALARRNLTVGLAGASAVWLALQGLLAWLPTLSLALATGVWALTVAVAYHVLETRLGVRVPARPAIHYTPGRLAGRALFSGSMVGLAVIMSRVGGPVWGGIFAAFPAVYLSTLLITARSAGVDFSRALATPLMVSGVINCVVYGLALRAVILDGNLFLATAVAYGASMASAFGTYAFLRRRTGLSAPSPSIPYPEHP
jgi:hypothetical protein